ncbi:MAG TPA: site-2 protease family protein [Candidatus Limnocylindria bacterium]|nr:site-2 protease family protein [Candidatus Limnocylindria bacterium]
MRTSLSIGRLFGFRVRLHVTWLIVLPLVVLFLASAGVPGPVESDPAARLVMALLVALLLLISVVAHELAHALAARRLAVPVDDVIVYVFGGTTNVEQAAPSPRSEALTALSGPLLSLLVGGLSLGGWSAASSMPGTAAAIATGVLWWVGTANVLLGLFNLLPAFPMDGGRILRAIFWRWRGDQLAGTRWATGVGRAIGLFLVGVGLVWAIASPGGLIIGLWLAVIGWMLRQTAVITNRRAEVGDLIAGLRVGEVMERDVPVIGPNLTIDTLLDQHRRGGGRSLYPVTMDGRLVGTIDVADAERMPSAEQAQTRVTDLMRRRDDVDTLTESMPLLDALGRFDRSRIDAFAVVDDREPDTLRGLLTRNGVVERMRERAARRAQAAGAAEPGR